MRREHKIWAMVCLLILVGMVGLFMRLPNKHQPGERLIHSQVGETILAASEKIEDVSADTTDGLDDLDVLDALLVQNQLHTPTIIRIERHLREAIQTHNQEQQNFWSKELTDLIEEMLILRPV